MQRGIECYLLTNAAAPEVLLYVPKENDDFQLVGVEYLSEGPNSLFGQEFDGPGAVPEHLMHVWIWKNNPKGMFAHFNPSKKSRIMKSVVESLIRL